MLKFILAFIFLSTAPLANEVIASYVPEAKIKGEGRLKVWGLKVYDATLFVQGLPEQNIEPPFALELHYLRDISGKKIAQRSLEEMEELGLNDPQQKDRWLNEMIEIFPDVTDGDKITGVLTENQTTLFYYNQKKIGEIPDPAFGKAFFDIWLNPETSSPDLRRKLLGENHGHS